jgi:nitrite reductase (NO-forming)
MTTAHPERPGGRARRQVVPAGLVLAYLAAGGVTALLGGVVPRASWLALHLVLLGAVSNAIVSWSGYFAAALLHAPPAGERAGLARTLGLNLGVVAVLTGVPAGRAGLVAAGAALVGLVILGHGLGLAVRASRALITRLGHTVWFYVAAAAALLAGAGLGALLAGGVAPSADAWRAMRLAHVHLNLLGWVGLAVIGTQFTLWPTVLRTRLVPGLRHAARLAFLLTACGLAVATAGFLARHRPVAAAGLAAYAAGLAAALVPFTRTLLQRRPHSAASWMLAAGTAWFAVAVLADLAALLASPQVVDLDRRAGRLVPVVVLGFGLQTLTGALTYLLPAVWGRGAHGNRRLARIVEAGWPARVVAVNLGVAVVAVAPAGGAAGRAAAWLAGLGLAAFVPLAAVALARRPVADTPARRLLSRRSARLGRGGGR